MANVRRFLDISTAHLSEEDKALLDSFAAPDSRLGPMTVSTCYGWWMYAIDDCYEDNCLSDNLTRICKHARKNGCDYILFDCDAETDEELPVFEEADA